MGVSKSKQVRIENLALAILLAATALQAQQPTLPREAMARQHYGADAPWYVQNIPFLEIDDPEIEQVYFYRWQLYRSHLREIGAQGTMVTEFLDNVPWGRQPYTDLNDSSSFHLLEGRWLRSPAVVDDLIDHLYTGGGNDRHFSESIAAASVAATEVTGDPAPALRHLDTMQYIFNQWDDHLDRVRGLYWIEPLLDATEYTIASIDASGAGFTGEPGKDQNRNGFTGGQSFRPSINSYQYGNALAIAQLARLAGKPEVAADYTQRAAAIRTAVLGSLWNPGFEHFTDRYQRSTKTVTAGEFIRGRELVGYLPWFYELPPKDAAAQYGAAWKHVLSPAELGGPHGLRTVEPSYPRYMQQYRYDQPTGLPECQWNGPSWPFQSSQALTAMANLLDDYPAAGVTKADYLRLLRQYTHQHLLAPGRPDLEEDYNPDTGAPIVGLARSNHYNHSTYNDLILSGLLGIRPRADDVLELAPLLPAGGEHPIRWFALEGLRYHGHELALVYDEDGTRYRIGSGLSVFIDGKRAAGPGPLHRMELPLQHVAVAEPARRVDLAVNIGTPGAPVATASSTISKQALEQGIDGREWFFPENPNGWSPDPAAGEKTSWYAVDFGQQRTLGSVEISFAGAAPASVRLEAKTAEGWQEIVPRTPAAVVAGGENVITFATTSTASIRVVVTPGAGAFRMIELKAFAP